MQTHEKDGMPPAVVQLTEVAGLSVSELTEIVRTALYDRHPKPNSWTWVAELYDDKVIYEVSPRGVDSAPACYFQAAYTLDRSGVVKANLGEAVEVKRKTTYVPVGGGAQESFTEDADYELELHEAANAPATIDLKIIKPGWGSSGFYPADVLKEDGPTAWQAGTHMYLDHPTAQEAKDRPERSIKDLAAVTISDPVYQENGIKGPGLYAKATVMPQYKEAIRALAPHIGVSIRAAGAFKEGEADGRKGRVITKINPSPRNSIDFVTKAGAGGQVIAIMESLRQTEEPAVVSSEQQESHDDTLHQEAEGMDLKEAQEQITALESDLKEANDKNLEESARADRAEGALAILEAQGQARKAMENISLPAAAKTRVVTKVSADPPMKEGKLDVEKLTEAVEAEAKLEADYLESLGVTGKVTDQGAASSESGDAEVKESLASGIGSFFNLSDDAAKRAANGR